MNPLDQMDFLPPINLLSIGSWCKEVLIIKHKETKPININTVKHKHILLLIRKRSTQ